MKSGCDIRGAKVRSKAENMEMNAHLFWLTVSNHFHSINVFLGPQGHIADIVEKDKSGSKKKISHLTASKCIIMLPGICRSTSSVRKKNYCLGEKKAIYRQQRLGTDSKTRRVMGDRPKA